jgi:acyl-CoA synthetase (AMP-forming)/AMP-acid ligase II
LTSTVHAAFVASATRTPQSDFLFTESVTAKTYGIPSGPVRWDQARAEVDRLRAAYASAGWGHGHRVGLLLENRPAFLYHWFALNALGVSVVPINSEMRSAELAYLIGHSEIGLVVTLPHRAHDLEAAAQQAGRPLCTVGAEADQMPAPFEPAPRAGEPVGLDSECALLYTSGTTGRPKGCILDNNYFLRAGQWYADLDGVCEVRRDQERLMTPLPLSHMNAMAFSTVVVLIAGGCLVQLDRFHPKTWLQSARESGATIVHYLGVMPAMLLSAPEVPADRDHAIRWAFGAGVDRKNHAPFEARFGFPLVEAWAMTETGAAGCIMANREPRHVGTSCFGRPEAFVEIRLVDEAGADVPTGMPGELLVRSQGDDARRYFFRGYLKDAEATAEAWAGGWFHTGDMVRSDAQGSLYFVDRKKNVIRRSGENISAVEVESGLNQHPAVKVSAVAATPDAVRGDEVLACIVLDPDAGGAASAELAAIIVEHALAQLAYYKAPGYVAFVDALPLTASQKIQRGELRQLAQALPGQAACFDTRSMKKRQD